jgi:hypothetical protein
MAGDDAVIRVYDSAGNVIEMHEQAGDFSKVLNLLFNSFRARIRLLMRQAPIGEYNLQNT